MKHTLKRTLSFLLALTMVLSLGLPAYAVGDIAVEDQVVEQNSAEDDIVLVDPIEDPAAEPVDGLVPVNDKVVDVPVGGTIGSVDDPIGVVKGEITEKGLIYPENEYTYEEAETGFEVKVHAPEGALPVGTEMRVTRLNNLADVQAAVDAAENLEGAVQLAADISFWLNGEEIEPTEGSKLLVHMSAPEIEGIAAPVVIHIPDGENAVPEIVEQIVPSDDADAILDTVRFEAEDFSVYAVVDGDDQNGTYSIKYEFYYGEDPFLFNNLTSEDGSVETYYQYVGEGETLYYPGTPTYTGSDLTNPRFLGWFTEDGEKVLDPDTDAQTGVVITGITESKIVRLYGIYEGVYYLIYHDESNTNIIQIEMLEVKDGNTDTLRTDNGDWRVNYTPDNADDNAFIGWATEQNVDASTYEPPETYTVPESGTLNLYPAVAKVRWIIFDKNDWVYVGENDVSKAEYIEDPDNPGQYLYVGKNNGGTHKREGTGAGYVSPKPVREGKKVEDEYDELPTTYRPGYDFLGWWLGDTDEQWTDANGNLIAEPGQLSANVELKAHWEAKTVNYTVIVWKQQVGDTIYDEANATEHYDVEFTQTRTAKTGQTVTLTDWTNIANGQIVPVDGKTYDFTGFHHDTVTNRDNLEAVVAADGSTTLNVYYNRNIITINFHYTSNAFTYKEEENGDYYYYTDPNDGGYYLIGTGPNAAYQPVAGDIVYYDSYNLFTSRPSFSSVTPHYKNDYNYMSQHTINGNYTYVYFNDFEDGWIWRYTSGGLISSTYYLPLYYRYTSQSGYYQVGTGPDPDAVGTHTIDPNSGASYQGLYESPFNDWPSDYSWQEESGSGLSFLGAFKLPTPTNTVIDLYTRSAGTARVTIEFVRETVDGSYDNTDEDHFFSYDSDRIEFKITDKYPGFYAKEYRTKAHGSSTWGAPVPLGSPDAEGNYTQVNLYTTNSWDEITGYYDLQIHFARKSFNITYTDALTGEKLGETETHVYEKDLTDHADTSAAPYTLITDTLLNDSDHEGYEFRGFYADSACSTLVFFDDPTEDQIRLETKKASNSQKNEDGTLKYTVVKQMPAYNLSLYAGFSKIRFRVWIQPNFGVLSASESTYFNADFGELIQEYADIEETRNYVRDPEGTFYYVLFDHENPRASYYTTELSEYVVTNADGSTTIYSADDVAAHALKNDNGDYVMFSYLDRAYTFMGWYKVLNKDMGTYQDYLDGKECLPPEISEGDEVEPWSFGTPIKEDTAIRAMWRRSGNIAIRFLPGDKGKAPEGVETTYTDPFPPYGDVTGYPMTQVVFADQSQEIAQVAPEITDEDYYFVGWKTPYGKIVQPNDIFTVYIDLADYIEQADGDPWYLYTLEAVYAKISETTSLSYVINAPEGATVNAETLTDLGKPVDQYDEVLPGYQEGTNELTLIPLNSRIIVSNGDGFSVTNYALIGWNDDEAKADAGEVKFQLGSTYGIGSDSTLYGVWAVGFNVYHTGVDGGNLKAYPMPAEGETFNLAGLVDTSKFLYAGYYLEGGFTQPAAAADGKIPAYDGVNWTFTTPETVRGDKITPVAGKTYYIKELPINVYLRASCKYTYKHSNGEIATMWILSDVDDLNYNEIGFTINGNKYSNVDTDAKVKVASQLTIIPVNNKDNTETYTAYSIWKGSGVKGGLLSYMCVFNRERIEYKGESLEAIPQMLNGPVVQYWVTPDGATVTGRIVRTYKNMDTANRSNINSCMSTQKVDSTIEFPD